MWSAPWPDPFDSNGLKVNQTPPNCMECTPLELEKDTSYGQATLSAGSGHHLGANWPGRVVAH